MNFQSSCKIITNQSLRHYSHESLTSQLGPPLFSNLSAKSISFIPRPETEQFAGARDSGRRGDRQRRRRGPGASTCPAAPVGGPNSDEDCRWKAGHVSQRRPRQPLRRQRLRGRPARDSAGWGVASAAKGKGHGGQLGAASGRGRRWLGAVPAGRPAMAASPRAAGSGGREREGEGRK